jgi:hypothetical protein
MVSSIAVSWIVGLAFLIVLLFSIQDIDSVLNSTLHMPVAQLFFVSGSDIFLVSNTLKLFKYNRMLLVSGEQWDF